MHKLGFSRVLTAALEETQRSYREATSAFEYKECISHFRSFLEDLHKKACVLVHAKRGGTSLYRLISDMGVHPLAAEREYARLMRNMNIEYGLMFRTGGFGQSANLRTVGQEQSRISNSVKTLIQTSAEVAKRKRVTNRNRKQGQRTTSLAPWGTHENSCCTLIEPMSSAQMTSAFYPDGPESALTALVSDPLCSR